MRRIERSWQTRNWLSCLLWPVSMIYGLLLGVRQLAYRSGICRVNSSELPVVVIGNLSVGGTGKTPLCAELVKRFQQAGWRPAIVSRGYGGQRRQTPHRLSADDTATTAGDEPVMLYRQTGVPVCVCIDRAAAVAHIARYSDADIVFSDDGVQHLSMGRVAEIIVIDGKRGLGNLWLLPAGPLRQSTRHLAAAELVAIQLPYRESTDEAQVQTRKLHHSLLHSATWKLLAPSQDQTFELVPTLAVNLATGRSTELASFVGRRVHAVAGIGHPQRFFDALQAMGILVEPHALPDHHVFTLQDVSFPGEAPVLVTAKDAVKLANLVGLPSTVHEVGTRVRLSSALELAIDDLERSLRQRFHQHPVSEGTGAREVENL